MNNKINKTINLKDDLAKIYESISQHQYQMQSFCLKNNMKFPPIAHLRNSIFNHIPTSPLQLTTNEDNPEYRSFEDQLINNQQTLKHRSFERKPSTLKMVFSKSNPKKRQQFSLHSRPLQTNQSKISIFKNMHHPSKKCYMSIDSANNPSCKTKSTHVRYFIDSLNQTKNNKEVTKILSQSLQETITKHHSENRNQFLSINRMSTINPQSELIKTLKGKTLHFQKSQQTPIVKRPINPKNLSRISFYKNADGIFPKKTIPFINKQQSGFEPWQPTNLQEQDYLQQIDK